LTQRGEAPRPDTQIELRGAGGEPADLVRTLLSHGVADLPPNRIAPDGTRLETVLPTRRGARVVVVEPAGRGFARVSVHGQEIERQIRRMLALDQDLSAFYAVAADDPALAWVTAGAGRMLRSPTVFEDVVKTICTTNCAWSGTVRMVSALVDELGEAAVDTPERHAFPAPAAMAEAGETFYRDTARAGYRGPYLRALATDVAEGRLDLEALRDPDLSDEEVADALLALAGVGPYAVAHMMMLLGRHRRLILDSWTRPKYRRVTGRARITDKGIERAFRRYREFAGLAFWLTLTEDWIPS
jgi:N-glycosylase/DNA lyase